MCKSQRSFLLNMQKAFLIANIGFDTAEKGPSKAWATSPTNAQHTPWGHRNIYSCCLAAPTETPNSMVRSLSSLRPKNQWMSFDEIQRMDLKITRTRSQIVKLRKHHQLSFPSIKMHESRPLFAKINSPQFCVRPAQTPGR